MVSGKPHIVQKSKCCTLFAVVQGFTEFLSFFSPEKLSSAKEENLGMHQVLDQTLQELNSL